MENTPLLLWWEIALFLFPFENFIADLARPGSKSKLGFSVLLQRWLHIGISHCFWNQPEKMSLCGEQGEMCQKNRRAAWTIHWNKSRSGTGFSHCPPCPRSCPLAPSCWGRCPGATANPCKGDSVHGDSYGERKKEQLTHVTWDSVSWSWGSLRGKQRSDQR